MKKLIFSLAMNLLILCLIISCDRPERKKMPDYSFFTDSFDKQFRVSRVEPFIIGDTTLNGGHFFCISVSNPSSDSVGLEMLQTYQCLAKILYNAILKQGDVGVLINLCRDVDQQRTDFIVIRKNEFSLPVVLLWDNSSKSRAMEFINAVNHLKDFMCTRSGGKEFGRAEKFSTEDCFQFPTDTSTQ
jgi:hypothetical protein